MLPHREAGRRIHLRTPTLRGTCFALSLVLFPALLGGRPAQARRGHHVFQFRRQGPADPLANGQVTYFVDQGPLSASMSNQQATAMVEAAGAVSNAVPTAGVKIVAGGSLNEEDVSGQDIVTGSRSLAQPSDVAPAAGVSVNWTFQALVLGNGAPLNLQTVSWKPVQGIQMVDNSVPVTSMTGIAAKALQVGPLDKGQQASSAACLNSTSQCVSFTAIGARPELAWLEGVSGIDQSLSVSATPAQITLRVRDTNGNPMAGGTATLFQSVYTGAPPCPPEGRCAAATPCDADVYGTLRARWHGDIHSGRHSRSGDNGDRRAGNGEHQHAADCGGTASLNRHLQLIRWIKIP